MVYKIVFSDRAIRDIQSILDDERERYSPVDKFNYVTDLMNRVSRLDLFPKRGNSFTLRGLEYWRMNHKAHTAFYRVIEEEKLVIVVAVLHSRMTWEDKL